MKNKFITAMTLEPNDKVAIVGCGGKTTLMYKMAHELKDRPVLVTTTTKIYPPSKNEVDYTFNRVKSAKLLQQETYENGRYLIYDGFDIHGKLLPPEHSVLEELGQRFDYTIMESDGSKGLPLKGYNQDEPCVPEFVTLTLGVATIWAVGEPVETRFVHRVKEFCEMTGAKEGMPITLEHIARMIAHPSGPFKRQTQRRILFINHLNVKEEYNRAMELIDRLPKEFLQTIQCVIAGNLYSSSFEYLWENQSKRGEK